MNDEDDLEYFQRRAEQELKLVQKADVPAVVAAHYQLAETYLERAVAEASDGEEPAQETGEEQ